MNNETKTETDLLEVKSLSKSYAKGFLRRRTPVIENVTFTMQKKNCVALMGHNGAGKTSTIKAILGLIRPDSGALLFRGSPIKAKDRNFIGYMPETSKLPLTLTCREILLRQLKFTDNAIPSRDYKRVVDAYLENVGLLPFKNYKIKELSKGMGRRLAWAQATIHDPQLVILDEPFQGLDPAGRNDLIQWIKTAKNAGKGLLISTHDFSSVFEVCDAVHILRNGRVVFSQDKNLPSLAQMTYRLSLSGCGRSELEHIRAKYRLEDWIEVEEEGYVLHIVLPSYPGAASWLNRCVEQGYVVVNFSESRSFDKKKLFPYFAGVSK
ncbi:MAG: ABC transporter ATP-binding protein [Oligoflexales bacterium]